jgi:hypothetical protein
MRSFAIIFVLLNILLVACADDPVSPCINDDLDSIPDSTDHDEDLYEVTVHLNTENCDLDYDRIILRFTRGGVDRDEDFTVYEDSAVATMDSLSVRLWRGWIIFYKDSTPLEYGGFNIDIRPDMLTDYYFDYLVDNRYYDDDPIKPDHEYMENQVFAAITDSLVNEFRTMEGYENAYYFVHDSTYYQTGLSDLNSNVLNNYPTIKTNTFIDYYIANQTNIAVNIVLAEDKFEYFDLRPNEFEFFVIDSLRSTDPNALGGLIYSRVGFSPSFNQALVFVFDAWGPLNAEGLIFYLERTDKFRIIAKFGRWIS